MATQFEDAEDPLSSTSFLDLLSTALAAVVILFVSAGADAFEDASELSALRVSQADSDSVSHLVSVDVGGIIWHAQTVTPSIGKQVYTAHQDQEYVCDPGSASQFEYEIKPVATSSVFGSEQYREFSAAVRLRYGIQVTALPQMDTFPALFSATANSEIARESVPIILVYEQCANPSPHIILATARSSANGDAQFNGQYSFAVSAAPPGVRELPSPSQPYFCRRGIPYAILSGQIRPKLGASIAPISRGVAHE